MTGFFIFLLVFLAAIFVLGLVLQVFFLLTVSRALGLCAPHNRTMEPGTVWLNLIPIFNWVWMFITVSKVSESLKYEYRERGMHRRDETYGHGLGIAMCISPLAGLMPFLVLTIIYWVKVAEYARKLEYGSSVDRYDDDDWDDREERRERRGRRSRRDRDEDDEGDRREERPWDRGR